MSSLKALVLLVSCLGVLAVACNKEDPAPSPPPVAGEGAAPQRAAQPAPAARPGETIAGTVAETMDSGGYTYLRITTASGDRWAAVKQTPVKAGQLVSVAGAMAMKNFESRTLKRKFELIYFGTLGGSTVPAAAVAKAHRGAVSAAKKVTDALPKADGPAGRTVAEVYGQAAALAGKKVSVRGRVVKVISGILGRTWIHIQDGSGSEQAKDYDLTVTTTATAAVGDQIVVSGILATKKDFGAGYVYAAIVENATIEKK